MGLFQSLDIGVLGLLSQSNKLNVISQNVSNVNTVGYKANLATFETLVNQQDTKLADALQGVAPGYSQLNQKNGSIQASDSTSDLAISGKGFFPVSDSAAVGGSIFYTRAGSFTPNKNGDYLNSSGYFLKGWRLDVNGNLPTELTGATVTASAAEAALQTVNVANLSVAAIPTTLITLKANLKSSETALANNSVSYVGNLSSTQNALPTATVDVAANLQSSGTIYGSFDFQVNKLFDQLQSLSAADRQSFSTAISNLFPGLTIPSNLLINQDALKTFVQNQYGSGVTSVQSFLTAVQPGLSSIHPLRNYSITPVAYDPLSAIANMASRVVPPNFQKAVTVYDSAGVKRDLNISYLKTADNSWAVEIYAKDSSQMTTPLGSPPGLLASGNITFDSTGALATISPALTAPISVSWNTPTTTNTLAFDFGTVGSATGLMQSTNSFSSNVLMHPDYDPTVATLSMSGGGITPHYSTTTTMTDNTGTTRMVALNFLKIADDTWAVEATAQPASDITTPTGGVPGQIAYGTVTFHGDETFESRVGSLVDAVFSTAQTNTQKLEAANAINTVLGSNVITTSPSLDNASVIKDKLITALQVPPYPVAPDALEQFVASVQAPAIGLSTSNLLKTYQIPAGTNGAIASVSPSLSQPITVNWVGATEPNTLQLDLGVAGQKDKLKQISTAYAATSSVTNNYSPIDTTKDMSSGTVHPNLTRPIDIVDSNGVLKTIDLNFLKTGVNTWAVEIAAKNAADVAPLPSAQIVHGAITFNGDGTLASLTSSLSSPIAIAWSDGATSTLTLNLGTAGPIAGTAGATVVGLNDGLTQVNGDYQTRSVQQNGSIPGESATISIDANGIVTGTYENGSVRKLYQLPLAAFVSPDRLQTISSDVFLQSNNSGDAIYFKPGQAEDSVLQSNALEQSNVDLSNEMSNLLIAQRAYQSNSKLITTADDMMDNLVKM